MFRLTLTTDYALRTLLLLAGGSAARTTVRDVAEFFKISPDHVARAVQGLAQKGVIRAERGRNGGISLARPPEQITVWEIVEIFEGKVSLLECVEVEEVCVIQRICRLRRVLARVGERLRLDLAAVTLADLVDGEGDWLVRLMPPEPARTSATG